MITIPIWLFILLCLATTAGTVATVAALARAQRRVDRILAEELASTPFGSRGRAS